MAYVFVNAENRSFYQAQTDTFINGHDYPIVCNDYAPNGSGVSAVKYLFQDYNERPVIVVINAVAGSPSHEQYELLVSFSGFQQTEFDEDVLEWRSVIDSVQAPLSGPILEMPRLLPGGAFEFLLNGEVTTLYRIEASTNLVDWTTVTNDITGGTVVRDGAGAAHRQRFYRAVEE